MRTGLPTFDALPTRDLRNVAWDRCLKPERFQPVSLDDRKKMAGMISSVLEMVASIKSECVAFDGRSLNRWDEASAGGLDVRPPFGRTFVELGDDGFGFSWGVSCTRHQTDSELLVLCELLHYDVGSSQVVINPWIVVYSLDENGLIANAWATTGVWDELIDDEDDDTDRAFRDVDWASLQALTVFAHVNARGVELVEVQPTRQQRRDAERRGDPVYKHYTLRIGPTVKRAVGTQPAIGNHRDTALHLVRGHVARYTAEAPLFGKHTGQFWIPAHVRGKAERGVIDKTYRVEAAS